MAKGKNQRLRFKRRRNAKTDYQRRMKMLRGEVPRAVVRISNTQVTCQIVDFEPYGDKILNSVNGNTLVEKFKRPKQASRKSIPACYLAGLALGNMAVSSGTKEAVLDLGLASSTRGNRIYSALKGMIDAGLDIPHSESIFPDDDRINGSHIDESISKAFEKSKKFIQEGGKK